MIIIFEIPILFILIVVAALMGAEIGDTLNWTLLFMFFASIICTIAGIYLTKKGIDDKDKGDTIVSVIFMITSFIMIFINLYLYISTFGKTIKAYEILDWIF